MKNLFFNFFLFLFLFCLAVSPAAAVNNKVGIHLGSPVDIHLAANLVNSQGGDWGYVTVVVEEKDFDFGKWQKFFDDCREKHLIPLVRLATFGQADGNWAKPNLENLQKWPHFLNSLNWPIKQQIVIIFNEPNHAQEWGGGIDARNYAQILAELIELFKQTNPNFFILNAGFDQAAGNTRTTQDEVSFLKNMTQTAPDIFDQLDGWASHSYPNHGFVGSPEDSGRRTIRGYEWELKVLKQLGLTKDLPVFITETGWPHQEGLRKNSRFYPAEKGALFLEKAFAIWQNDEQVWAITPFMLNYPLEPFDHFSWLNEKGEPYPQFEKVLGISKIKAEPEQIESYAITSLDLPELLPTNYFYQAKVKIKNTGQWIMGERKDFQLSDIKIPQGELLFPGQERILEFSIQTGTTSGEQKMVLGDKTHTLYVFKPWDLKNPKVSLGKQIITRIKLWLREIF